MSDLNHSGHDSDHDSGHDSGHGHEDKVISGAGHEMDVPPTKELFNIIWGLGALTLLSLATCVQLFNNQQQDILAERGKESSSVLMQYRQGMDAVTKSAGEVDFKDSTGKEVKQRYVPLAVARELVLSKPERMLAAPAPVGWQHPDDIAAGGQAGAPPAGMPAGAPPPSTPTELAPGTQPPAGTPTTDAPGTPTGTALGTTTPGDAKAAPATPAGASATDAGKSGTATPGTATPAPAAPGTATPAPAAPTPVPAH